MTELQLLLTSRDQQRELVGYGTFMMVYVQTNNVVSGDDGALGVSVDELESFLSGATE